MVLRDGTSAGNDINYQLSFKKIKSTRQQKNATKKPSFQI
jgi:hypothetical protein